MRSLAATLIATCVMATRLMAQAGATTDDWDVFAAIMDHEVRPEIDRFRSMAGSGPPSLALVLDESVSLCGPERNRAEPPCVQARSVETLRTPVELPNGRRMLPGGGSFDGPLRTELVEGFLSRNRQRERLTQFARVGMLLVPHAGLRDTLRQHARDTVGYTAFGLPSYSTDGHALAYVFYSCGALCGQQLLVLLSRASGQWTVEFVSLLSIA